MFVRNDGKYFWVPENGEPIGAESIDELIEKLQSNQEALVMINEAKILWDALREYIKGGGEGHESV